MFKMFKISAQTPAGGPRRHLTFPEPMIYYRNQTAVIVCV